MKTPNGAITIVSVDHVQITVDDRADEPMPRPEAKKLVGGILE